MRLLSFGKVCENNTKQRSAQPLHVFYCKILYYSAICFARPFCDRSEVGDGENHGLTKEVCNAILRGRLAAEIQNFIFVCSKVWHTIQTCLTLLLEPSSITDYVGGNVYENTL